MAGAGGVYTGGGATVVMDPASVAYVKLCHPGSGPDRHLRQKTGSVAILARMLAPVGETGRLKAGIRVDWTRNEHGRNAFGYAVISSAYYSAYVHEGTGPSPRWPNTRRVMKWRGHGANEVVHRDFVMHPGTPAQPFLRDALIAMVG